MRTALAMVTLAACGGSQLGGLGAPCSAKDKCATGEVCDMTDPAGAICIDAAGDLDGDGIPNGMDFCDHMAGGLYDEDGDGIGDDCDACPIAPPPATPDPDGDAVDSPCDPDPHTPGDQILLFDGFRAGLNPAWKPTTAAAWHVEGGELIVNLSAVAGEDYMAATVIGKANTAIQASYRIDKIETSATTHLVAVRGSDPRPAGVSLMECGVVRSDTSTVDVVDVETNQNSASTPAANAFSTASLYRVAAYSAGTQAQCVVIGDGTSQGAVQAPITPDALAAVSLGARGVTARFQWFLVVGH